MSKKRVNVVITDECHKVLSEIADEYGTSISASINVLAKLYKREQEALQAFKNMQSLQEYLDEARTEKHI